MNHTLQNWAFIAEIITAASLGFGVVQITINRQQLYSNTIARCLETFQKINIQTDTVDDTQIKKFIDLVGEELFYIQKSYIPKDVALEWLDGMIDFIPVVDKYENILNKDNCIKFLCENRATILKNYPRIKSAFTLGTQYEFNLVYNDTLLYSEKRLIIRKNIVLEIFNNIKHFEF